MNYALVDAARSFKALLSRSTEEELDQAYQVLANNTNDSEFANTAEPLAGLCAAVQAEITKRALIAKWDAEDQEEQPEPAEPFTNDDRVFGPEETS